MAGPPERTRAERWSNPLTVAVVAAAIAGFSNLWLAYENNRAALALEAQRAESERVLEMLKAGDPARVRENLRFLIQLGLVRDAELRRRIEAWEANPRRAPFYLSADWAARDRVDSVRQALRRRLNETSDSAAPEGSGNSY